MFANAEITEQPVFYLFIAASILLSLGYSWGKRRNRSILRGTLDGISEVLKPRDQQYTNIGGLTGYHANFLPGALKLVRRVDLTITLLPRQSWLYMPFSWLTRRFDRLYMSFELNKKARGRLREGHLIERSFEKMRGNRIENSDTLVHREVTWGKRTFHLYGVDDAMIRHLQNLQERLGRDPGRLRHVALVPEQDRYYLFVIPHFEETQRTVAVVSRWFEDHLTGTEEE